jgi:hypothetical protein
MSPLGRNSLIAAAVVALVFAGVSLLLKAVVLPGMIESGNRILVTSVASALTQFYADFQRWPNGSTPEELWRELGGRAAFEEAAHAGTPVVARTVAMSEVMLTPNYMRDIPTRTDGFNVLDGWETPLHFELNPLAPARVISAGPDRKFGTPDDVSAEAAMAPRQMRPMRIDYKRGEAIREYREIQEARRQRR